MTSKNPENSTFDEQLRELAMLVAERTGISLSERQHTALATFLQTGFDKDGPRADEALLRRLKSASVLDPAWAKVLGAITVPETYFFRDSRQNDLLAKHVIPEFAQRARQGAPIRVWSAGCSTGEELYTIAIMMQQELGDLGKYRLELLGTDIDADRVKRARTAEYGSWSFRNMPADLREKHFTACRGGHRISETIRKHVSFRQDALVAPSADSQECADGLFDLIICRNVLIYLLPKARISAYRRFCDALVHGGYLLTGHNELYDQNPEMLEMKLFPEGYIYQKPKFRIPTQAPKPVAVKHSAATQTPRPPPRAPVVQEARRNTQAAPKSKGDTLVTDTKARVTTALEQGNYGAVAALLHDYELQTLQNHPELGRALVLTHANLGQLDKARALVSQLLGSNAFDADLHFLLGQINESERELAAASSSYQRAIYLDSEHVMSYLSLAHIHEHTGNKAKARQLLRAAWRMLKSKRGDERVSPLSESTADELIEQLRSGYGFTQDS